jgi:hypothetical protein
MSTFFDGPVIEGEWAELLVEEARTRRDIDDYTVHPGFTVIAGYHDDVVETLTEEQHTDDSSGYKSGEKVVRTTQAIARRAFFIVGKSVDTKLEELGEIVEQERELRREAGAEVTEMEDRIKGLEVERDEAMAARDEKQSLLDTEIKNRATAVDHASEQSKQITEQDKQLKKLKKAIGELQYKEILE